MPVVMLRRFLGTFLLALHVQRVAPASAYFDRQAVRAADLLSTQRLLVADAPLATWAGHTVRVKPSSLASRSQKTADGGRSDTVSVPAQALRFAGLSASLPSAHLPTCRR